jgi:hypothetical protein
MGHRLQTVLGGVSDYIRRCKASTATTRSKSYIDVDCVIVELRLVRMHTHDEPVSDNDFSESKL